ncbi:MULTISPECIES: LacI family DNA-binding transcriptional regulator [unclassified Microbacterium]
MSRPTRRDVADRAGVSTAVVSYVVNDGPRPVAESTRARVLAAIADLGYRPNAAARALKLSRTNIIGLLITDIRNPFFSEFAKLFQDLLHQRGYSVTIGNTELDPELERSQIDAMLAQEVDGVVTFGLTTSEPLERLMSEGVSVVSLDWRIREGPIPTIAVDDYGATQLAVRHLMEDGHTEVGFIGGPELSGIAGARIQAWRNVVGESGISPERLKEIEAFGEFSRRGGFDAMTVLLSKPKRPTAVFISSDVQALGALHACRELGLRVPEDVAIVTFDGTEDSAFSAPPLSVIQLPLQAMAEQAVDAVLGVGEASALHVTLPHSLSARASCGH